MSKVAKVQNPQNIFLIAEGLQNSYKNFVKTFQVFQNKKIRDWVQTQMEKEALLYKDPLIELNFQFEKGKSLDQLIKEDIILPEIKDIFNITPYKHQSEAIEKVCKGGKNIIVSTGTGSGKSMCYWIPIVNTCIQMKSQSLDGIKAVVIFPMNALANSQYHDLAKALDGSGLKVGRYTGDTPYSREEGENLLEKNSNRKPYDCEILSRTEMQDTPPDILITNYVMLDYILTRHDDKKLFPAIHAGFLKYLVLDEIHTYNGNTGADVACLVRRLKERTSTIGKLRCIGTSATIQDNKKHGGVASIIEFANKIFGEEFQPDCLIEATFVNIDTSESDLVPLSQKIKVKDTDLSGFDGTFNKIIPLAEKLLGRFLEAKERTPRGLGNIFQKHTLITFLRKSLRESVKTLGVLAKEYKETYRNNERIENCLVEIKAALLLGTVATIIVENKERPLLVPKLHVFFSQGQDIASSLTKEGPYPSVDGDLKCKQTGFYAYPLYFCRNCGQEFYSAVLSQGNVYPRDYEVEESGELIYLAPVTQENSTWQPPEQWLDGKGNIKDTYINAVPESTEYCPKCNQLGQSCDCEEKLKVWKLSFPFQFCPSCELFYTKQPAEYSKLFSFNSTGRSSATDILALELLSTIEKDQRKVIIFSDNRQDTALQAEHMNEFQRRTNFRRIFYQVLKEIHQSPARVDDTEIGRKIFDFMDKNGLLPDYQKETEIDEFSTVPPPEREFVEFLTFLALSDIMSSQYFLDVNLEKVGLLQLEYDGLEKLIKHAYVTENPELANLTENQRYDYVRGILDIFRWAGAIGNSIFDDTVNKYENWESKIRNDLLFDINHSRFTRVGFAFEKPKEKNEIHDKRQRIEFKSMLGTNSTLVNWTRKFFDIKDTDDAKDLLNKTLEILIKTNFISEFWTNTSRNPRKKSTYKLYHIREKKILFNLNPQDEHVYCPKCQKVYYFREFSKCISMNCSNLKHFKHEQDHFYLNLYRQLPDKEKELHAREHSAQLEGKLREQFETSFKDGSAGSINVLVCTPTMELGIDIGDLSAIIMRNVPPDPSRYAQRAGRAGRNNQPSIIAVFCGTGMNRGPHDQYFYKEPEKIVSGKIQPPNFLLDNKKLIRRHINSIIFEYLDLKISKNFGDLIKLDDTQNDYPMFHDVKREFQTQLSEKFDDFKAAINRTFANEIAEYDWFTTDFIENSIKNFLPVLDSEILKYFRTEFHVLHSEMDSIHTQMSAG